MDEDNQGNNDEPPERWTCEACGCNTNAAVDRACSICGTASGPSILRRAGYAARAGLFARGLGARGDFLGENGDIADLWGRVVDGAGFAGEDHEAMAALAMEVAGQPVGRNRESSRQRLLDAARTFNLSNREGAGAASAMTSRELKQAATDNATSFSPKWISPSQIGGRVNTTGNGIQIGDGERQNVAHLPVGAGEGRPVRALEAVPRNIPISALVSPGQNQERRHRRTFGFRVAFDHPEHEAGSSLGGCYLVGVTTSSFSNFGERNGLQQSPLFWGVEDGGNKFEGSRYSSHTARGSRPERSNYGAELGPGEAPLNEHGVLFGAREVVTVVIDVDSRAMTFWRDDEHLGTLVTNLPRGSGLYPIAVPFNAGSTVAITGMEGNPLTLLKNFNSGWKEAQQKKDDENRKRLASTHSLLIKDGELTPRLVEVLKSIFSWYATSSSDDKKLQLDRVEAARMWFYCGIKLANLDSMFEADELKTHVLFDDFLRIVRRVAKEDGERMELQKSESPDGSSVEVGDRVQLIDGYESKGDASTGPLRPGERGRVVELQRGPTGQKHSVRVLYGGRRWWYQPQAVVSERSGLIESSAVWWLHQILRVHGFDHNLEYLVGKPVTSSSWEFGDIVVPSKISTEMTDERLPEGAMESAVGRIVASASHYKSGGPPPETEPSDKKAGTVLVEYVNERFIELAGLSTAANATKQMLKTRRVNLSDLVHSTVFHGVDVFKNASSGQEKPCRSGDFHTDMIDVVPFSVSPEDIVSDKIKKDIESIAKLDARAIEAIASECKKNPGSLASLFAVGLHDEVVLALENAMDKAVKVGPKESLSQTVEALGALTVCICKRLFPQQGSSNDDDDSNKKEDALVDVDPLDVDDEMDEASVGASEQQNNPAGEFVSGLVERGLGEPSQVAGRLSSLQQRRSVLLALMSRARRNGGALNDLSERENDAMGLRQVMPGMPPFGHGVAGNLFSGAGAEIFHDGTWDQFFGISGTDAARAQGGGSNGPFDGEPRPPTDGQANRRDTSNVFLWSILCGSSSGPLKKALSRDIPGTAMAALFRSLGSNSLTWAKALLEIQRKEKSANDRQSPVLLQTVSDEDDIPILRFAIKLGCSLAILKFLIQNGAQVGKYEVCLAAYTNQPGALTTLLQHATYSHGSIDLKKCSADVAEVVKRAGTFQTELKEKMDSQAGGFIGKCLCALLRFGLLCRSHRHESTYWTACSETITGTLSGYAMLRALQTETQQAASRVVDDDEDDDDAEVDEEYPPGSDYDHSSLVLSSHGLLSIIPVEVLSKVFLPGERDLINLLLLIEDHLYCKSTSDGAAGLTLLIALLEKFPFLSSSTEIHRFGFNELVASHFAMASGVLDEVSGNQPARTANVALESTADSSKKFDGSIRCPAKHAAVLHITRHSSFRCDICGKGVERGRPMHGCRDCDWDACFECTDHKTAYAKSSHLKKLAEQCRESLCSSQCTENLVIDKTTIARCLQKLADLDNTSSLRNLSICLQQRDAAAIRELAQMLEEPGQITNHQFSFSVLPALHASLLSKGSDSLRGGSFHKSKKARVVGECGKGASYIARCLLHGYGTPETDEEMEDTPVNDENRIAKGGNPEIVRRLHKVLSFNETLSSKGNGLGASSSAQKSLKSLIQPIDIQLWAGESSNVSPLLNPLLLRTEPLVSIEDIELYVLRTCKFSHPSYVSFCQRLANEGAIIVEQARTGRGKQWRLGHVVSYNDKLGCHGIKYAKSWKGQGSVNETPLEVNADSEAFNNVKFGHAESRLVLAAREYYILARKAPCDEDSDSNTSEFDRDRHLASDTEPDILGSRRNSSGVPSVGKRVELKNASTNDQKGSHTILSVDVQGSLCVAVSDSGIIETYCLSQIVQPSGPPSATERRRSRRQDRDPRDPFSRGFPFLSARSNFSESNTDRENGKSSQIGVIKRSWSALSLMEQMKPIEISSRDEPGHVLDKFVPGRGLMLRCDQGMLIIDQGSIQVPPLLCVEFSTRDTLATFDMSSKRSLPLVGALKQLKRMAEPGCSQEGLIEGKQSLFYTIKADGRPGDHSGEMCSTLVTSDWRYRIDSMNKPLNSELPQADKYLDDDALLSVKNTADWVVQSNRSRKLSGNSISFEGGENLGSLCDGLSETCVQCMEVLGLLSDLSDKPNTAGTKASSTLFENLGLSTKLSSELDDPLTVVGGALPDWCISAPMFAPRIFSYESRRLLLERSAFGVSRSTLKQQENLVNVGRLRARMASLRGRAVELVGEAFSGGSEDPTALQLQADELYGMEENLSNRVKAAFRAEQWEEKALDVAKAAIERDHLLSDAEKIFEKIAMADSVCGRRLEVRFFGESGFDAAAGPEAGVTRGFFSDVAEALLSCENVSGVHCAQICPPENQNYMKDNDKPLTKTAILYSSCKLPMFIPDTDAKSQVIIPTPRSDPRSGLGVFPRPLSPLHHQYGDVLARYKFMGRLFAAAMRDGFMFPLPLAASFLSLVQQCTAGETDDGLSLSSDDMTTETKRGALPKSAVLTAADLPRPGFLGGEIYGVDVYICRALDQIDVDAIDKPQCPQQMASRYSEIARDKNFARVALGKSYDCSFEEYFLDRTFVDPLDPTQGPEAMPLCPDGHEKQVTIHSVREYVMLAKQFMLHDGVIGQAQAFRSGVDDFFSAEYLRLFTPDEIQRDVCGSGDNTDNWDEADVRKLLKLDGGKGAAEALVAVAAIGGEGGALSRRFGTSSPTIGYLVKSLVEATPKQRRQFLSFVTSVPIVTPGKIEVVPIMSPSGEFQPMSDPSCLPRANTCSRRLYLPKFENYESFSQLLWAVVKEESKFKGFYEWRGN